MTQGHETKVSSFDGWWKEFSGDKYLPENQFIGIAYKAGAASRKGEIDGLNALNEMSEQKVDDLVLRNIELQKRIDKIEIDKDKLKGEVLLLRGWVKIAHSNGDKMRAFYSQSKEKQKLIDELNARIKELELINFDSELHFDAAKEHIERLQNRIDKALKILSQMKHNGAYVAAYILKGQNNG